MSDECASCGGTMIETRETVAYDCGLEGVMLEGVTVARCPACGEREVEVPKTLKLHEAIATALAGKPERLGPKEIRFLRKYLGLSGTDFAAKLGVDKATVSRWERVEAPTPMGGQAERLLRVLILSEKPVETYSLEAVAIKEPRPSRLRFALGRGGWHTQAA